jgi:hypothetical protein
MPTFRIKKVKQISWKESLRKEKSDVASLSNMNVPQVRIDWKSPLRQKIVGTTISTPSPAHTAYLRAEYLKKGHLTNSHKKYINIISSQTVITKGCSGC